MTLFRYTASLLESKICFKQNSKETPEITIFLGEVLAITPEAEKMIVTAELPRLLRQ